jgi:hypothetical protein
MPVLFNATSVADRITNFEDERQPHRKRADIGC